MKKIIFILALVLSCGSLYAQERTQKTHFAHLNILGAHYNYVFPIGKNWTFTPHIGISSELGWNGTNYFSWNDNEDEFKEKEDWFYSILGNVGFDIRYYYNFYRRMEQNRPTAYNSGNFFAVDFQYMPPAMLKHNIEGEWRVVAYPCWGARRVYQSKYLIETTIGLLTGVQGGDWGVRGPKFDLKMGLVF